MPWQGNVIFRLYYSDSILYSIILLHHLYFLEMVYFHCYFGILLHILPKKVGKQFCDHAINRTQNNNKMDLEVCYFQRQLKFTGRPVN